MKVRCKRLQSLALAIILAMGAGVVWGLATGLLFVFAIEVFLPINGDSQWQQLTVLQDGNPVIVSYSTATGVTYRTLDGQPRKTEGALRMEGASLAGPPSPYERFRDLLWPNRLHNLDNNTDRWYAVHDGKLDGRVYLVGYNVKSKQRIGYAGRNGFGPDLPPPEEQFPVDGRKYARAIPYLAGSGSYVGYWETEDSSHGPYLLTDEGLYYIDIKSQTVKLIRKDADLLSVGRAYRLQPAAEGAPGKPKRVETILLRTPDRLIVVNPDGNEIEAYPLPVDLRNCHLTCCQVPDNQMLTVSKSVSVMGESTSLMDELTWIDTAGKVVRHEQVDLQTPSRHATRDKILDITNVSLAVPSPGALATFVLYYPWGPGRCSESTPYAWALPMAWRKTWPMLLITSIVSIVLAVLCFLRQRKYAMPWTPVWTIFVLLFGLPAYFGYLAHRAWPGRLPCPHCGKLAPRDRSACFACGQEFPEPALKGTEVFA